MCKRVPWCPDGGPCRNSDLIDALRAEVARLCTELAAAEAREQGWDNIAKKAEDAWYLLERGCYDRDYDQERADVLAALRKALDGGPYADGPDDHAALDAEKADAHREGAEAALRQAVARVQTYNKGEWQSVSRDDIVRLIRVSLPLEPEP